MEDNKIQSILQDALEEEVPSSQINLWPTMKASLVVGKQVSIQQGSTMSAINLRRSRRLAFVFIIITALAVIAFATPQGRSFAQSVLQFFTRAESKSLPLESDTMTASEPDQSAPTAEPPAPLTSAAEAEAKVGFEIAELPFVPDGFNYLGARLYGNAVSLEYETLAKDGHLIIMQSQEVFYQSDWDSVPTEEITPVKIGELDGEFVEGMFVVYAGETTGTWNPEAHIQRLRWVKDGIWFEMTKYGEAKEIEYLDQTGLIELAESLEVK